MPIPNGGMPFYDLKDVIYKIVNIKLVKHNIEKELNEICNEVQ